MDKIQWGTEHTLWVSNESPEDAESLDPKKLRSKIEPWLTALFQSEHLSLLTGAGISYAAHRMATENDPKGMNGEDFTVFATEIAARSKDSAKLAGRGDNPNIEDKIRVANEIIHGMCHLGTEHFKEGTSTAADLQKDLERVLKGFITDVLTTER